MPDASDHSLPYVEQGGIKFGKLSVTDRSKLLRDYKKAARAELEQSLSASNLPQEQSWAERRGFDQDIWGARRWVEYINQFDGQIEVFRTSLSKQNPPETIDKLLDGIVLSPAGSVELACKISSVPYAPPAPVVPNMQQVGMIDGKPVYVAVEGADAANPTTSPTPNRQGFGT